MDAYSLLDLTAEELCSRVRELHRFSCYGSWQYETDFEFEIESESYEDGIKEVAERLAEPGYYPVNVSYERLYEISLPIKDEDGVWRLVKFKSYDPQLYDTSHKYRSSYAISKHPSYIAKIKEIEEEKKKKKEDEMRAAEIRLREKELEIYRKIKKELENEHR